MTMNNAPNVFEYGTDTSVSDGDRIWGPLSQSKVPTQKPNTNGLSTTNKQKRTSVIGEPLENGSFETGTFSAWRTVGDTNIETADFGVTPPDGSFQALVTNGFSDSGGSVVDSDLEEFLNLAPGVLDGLGNGDVTEGSSIKQTFTANAGDILTFDWDFLTNEATPEDVFNDFAFFSVIPFTLELADTREPIFFETLADGFNEETGYQTATVAISEAGTYTLSFGVVDVEDNIIDSGLLIDNVRIDDGMDAGGVFYSTDRATDQVFQIDPQTGEATLVGDAGFDTSFSGLSIDDGDEDGDESLFASDLFDPSTFEWSLATLDLDTGAADIVGPQFDSDVHAIAHQDGTLYGFSLFQGLGTLDPDTGVFTPSFGFSTLPVEMRGADVDESTNTLFALGADNALYTIDVDTGTASFVGSTGVDFNFRMGLAYNPQDDQLYALGDDSGSGDNLYRIDKATGAATLIGNTGLVEADSLEFVIPPDDGGGPSPSEDSDLFEDVILHEMAHLIGFGTIWQEKDLLTGAGGADPRFVGVGATDEYNDIFGVSESGVPVEADFGPGTALSHWDEEVFDNELMTGFINFGENPLSRITAASMGDLDYEVNVGVADPYTPPGIGSQPGESAGQILTMNLEKTFVEPIAERG